MSGQQSSNGTTSFRPQYHAPRFDSSEFLGTIIATVAIAFVFLPVRLYARWRTFRRFFWDDALVIFAWLISLIITIMGIFTKDGMYLVMAVGGMAIWPPPSDFPTTAHNSSRNLLVALMLFYAALWSIKLGFLIFFRRLGATSLPKLKWHWWGVAVFTMVCYLACYTSLPYKCSLGSWQTMLTPYCSQEQNLSFISMKTNCALDVFTDCLIVSIPFHILSRVRLSTRQRVALFGVFSLVLVTIVFAIVRATLTTTKVSGQMDPIWIYVWTCIELNIAIIVACVASYRTLFTRDRAHNTSPVPPRRPFGFCRKLFSSLRSSEKSKVVMQQHQIDENWSSAELPYLAPWREGSPTSTDEVIPPSSPPRAQVRNQTV